MITKEQALGIVTQFDAVISNLTESRAWHAARQQQIMALTEYLQRTEPPCNDSSKEKPIDNT